MVCRAQLSAQLKFLDEALTDTVTIAAYNPPAADQIARYNTLMAQMNAALAQVSVVAPASVAAAFQAAASEGVCARVLVCVCVSL